MESLGIKLRSAVAQFQTLSIPRRIAVAATAVLILLSVLLLVKNGTNSSAREYLFGGREFSRDELLAIETAFGDAALKDWRIVGYRVEVPSGRKAEYLAALSSKKLLFGLERPFENGGLFVSSRVRDMQYKREKQQKMARVVGGMPGIAEVAVEYTESKPRGFPRTSEKRAVVAVRAVAGRHLDHQEVTAIRKAIVGSEAGLPEEHVAVLDINAKRTYDGVNDNATLSSPGNLLAARTRMYEDRLQRKLLNRLVNYPGLVVEVNAQLSLGDEAGTGQPMVPQSVAVSVGVPSSYYARLWKQRNTNDPAGPSTPPASPQLASLEQETLHKVEEIVTGMLQNVDLPGGRDPHVVVRTDEDFAQHEKVPPATVGPVWDRLARHGQPLMIALVALAFVIVWLGLTRKKNRAARTRATPGELDESINARKTHEDSAATEEDTQNEPELERSALSSGEIQAQLSNLVQQNPDAAVDALRKWIKKVA